jgi:hypothetical protein
VGSGALAGLGPVLDVARAWAGPGCLGLIASGSHASGEAVWIDHGGRRVSLSDLDLYALLPDARARAGAAARADAAREGLAARLLEHGLAAPLEVGFLTEEGLERLAARPGTIELRRHGRVLEGDPGLVARVPSWSARDVSREEVALLLENRAFELLWAWVAASRDDALASLQARHAVLKTALDLAAVRCLRSGEYPDGAAARVAWARKHAPAGTDLPPWDEALDFRRRPGAAPAFEHEWRRTARAWEAAWRECVADGAAGRTSFDAARTAAARAPWRRRLRQAIGFRPRSARTAGPPLVARLARCGAGTPVHRLNASAATLVMLRRRALERGDAGESAARDLAEARSVIADLGVLDPALPPPEAAREALRLWDGWVLDGRRFGELA